MYVGGYDVKEKDGGDVGEGKGGESLQLQRSKQTGRRRRLTDI